LAIDNCPAAPTGLVLFAWFPMDWPLAISSAVSQYVP
jgi:hypothetical protein